MNSGKCIDFLFKKFVKNLQIFSFYRESEKLVEKYMSEKKNNPKNNNFQRKIDCILDENYDLFDVFKSIFYFLIN